MQSETSHAAPNGGNAPCSNCGAVMPSELRFCRACGTRLGEDVAEYTETVRLPNGQAAASTAYAFGSGPQGPQGLGPTANPQMQWYPKKKRKAISGMAWLFIGLLIFFVVGGAFTSVIRQVRRGVNIEGHPPAPLGYVGVDNFRDAEGGGVTFNDVGVPDSPADKAGLVGGDVIVVFDNHAVNNRSEIINL
ncbi:MAG: hypothetical protein ABJC05_05105, partial [Pyrinomonadaceae bacterium]